jgi:2-polyprenyl-6-methoxyphenol hydroxylase-like FAD-dependent oxidoreductase
MRIIVIGAGIGGLAAALTLGRSGFEVQLFEQASVLREIGAGVQISPNATRIRDWRTITCLSAQRWMTTARGRTPKRRSGSSSPSRRRQITL